MAAEEKAKAYDEALERAKECITDKKFCETEDTIRSVIEYIFPKLAESENEMIRKWILEKVQGYASSGIPCSDEIKMADKAIDYLEKQKEQKWSPSEGEMGVLYKLCYLSNQITDEDDTELTRLYQDLKREYFNGHSFENMFHSEKQKEPLPIPDKLSGLKSLMLQYLQSAANRKDDTEIERDTDLWGRKILDYVWKHSDEQKEQKPLTTEETELNSIAFLEQMGYTCIPPVKEQKPAQTAEEKEYVRTLKGLISDFIRDCGGCTIDTEYYQKICNWLDGRHIEQKQVEKQDYSGLNDLERAILRGFLSAGVENVTVTIIKETAKECLAQMKPEEWSEEDEEMIGCIIDDIREAKRTSDKEYFKELCDKEMDWLKSLRPSWKPSEEQMKALERTTRLANFGLEEDRRKALVSLYEQLKRLGVKDNPEYYQHFDPDC